MADERHLAIHHLRYKPRFLADLVLLHRPEALDDVQRIARFALNPRRVVHRQAVQRRALQPDRLRHAARNAAADCAPLEALAAHQGCLARRLLHIARADSRRDERRHARFRRAKQTADSAVFGSHRENHADRRCAHACRHNGNRHAHQNHARADCHIANHAVVGIIVVRPRHGDRLVVFTKGEDVLLAMKLRV